MSKGRRISISKTLADITQAAKSQGIEQTPGLVDHAYQSVRI